MSDQPEKPLALPELPELRRKTEAVSRFQKEQIAAHLETLRPLLSPERILGKSAGGKLEVPGAEKALAELRQSYKPFATKPYNLPETLDPNWLTLVGNALDLHAWEYTHTIDGKPITITSPMRWVVNYRTNYTLAQFKNVVGGKEGARPEYLRQFVVNALVLQLALNRHPGLTQLFSDLRYELTTTAHPELQQLPLVTITSGVSSFRPADNLIQAATAFSGIPAFIELIDIPAIRQTEDPLKQKIEEMVR